MQASFQSQQHAKGKPATQTPSPPSLRVLTTPLGGRNGEGAPPPQPFDLKKGGVKWKGELYLPGKMKISINGGHCCCEAEEKHPKFGSLGCRQSHPHLPCIQSANFPPLLRQTSFQTRFHQLFDSFTNPMTYSQCHQQQNLGWGKVGWTYKSPRSQ